MEKAISDLYKMADNPIEAASVWIVTPEQRPHAVAIPSFFPYEIL